MLVELALGASFVFGLGVGSFLNVVILRLGRESLRGRSKCPNCGKVLRWYELIPVFSFLIQRARCRGCRQRISFQYPLVELLTAALFLLTAARFSLWSPFGLSAETILGPAGWWIWPLAAFWLIYVSLMAAIAVYDAKFYLIPDKLVGLLWLAAGGAAVYQALLEQRRPLLFPAEGLSFFGPAALIFGRIGVIGGALAGIAAAVGLVGGVWFLSRGRAMGLGDVKLAFFMGLALGWPDTLMALIIAFVTGALFALPLLLLKRKTMKSFLPFGPFLVWGTLVTMLVGDKLAYFYFSVFPRLI